MVRFESVLSVFSLCFVVFGNTQYYDDPSSPCPNIFQYSYRDGRRCGIISRPSAPYGSTMTLKASFSVGERLPQGDFGRIDLLDGKSATLKHVMNGSPISFIVYFPTQRLPSVTKILIDGSVVCKGPAVEFSQDTQYVSSFTLTYVYSTGDAINTPFKFGSEEDRPSNNWLSGNTNIHSWLSSSDEGSLFDDWTSENRQSWNSRPEETVHHIQQEQPWYKITTQKTNTFTIPENSQWTQNQRRPQWTRPSNNQWTTEYYERPRATDPPRVVEQPVTQRIPQWARPEINRWTSQYERPRITDPPRVVTQRTTEANRWTSGYERPRTTVPPQTHVTQRIPQRTRPSSNRWTMEQPKPRPTEAPALVEDRVTFEPRKPQQHVTTPPVLVDNSRYPDADADCGIVGINNRFIKGSTYEKGDWPWLVAIYVIKSSSVLSFHCGGTLVTKRHVITAAHCTTGKRNNALAASDIILRIGAYDLQDWSDGDVQQLGVRKLIRHPHYVGAGNYQNDIAILMTVRDVILGGYVTPACMWRGNTDLANIVGQSGMVVGWGQAEEDIKTPASRPRGGEVPIVSTNTCRTSVPKFQYLTSNTTLCAGSRNGAGPCNGDSGGGLYLLNGYKWYLRGIVSLSLPGDEKACNLEEYVLYTDAAQYGRWIHSVITTAN